MTRWKKIALGIATAWPLIYLPSFVVAIKVLASTVPPAGAPVPMAPHWVTVLVVTLFPLHLLTILLIWGLIFVYGRHINRNARLDKNTRQLWSLIILFLNVLAMPIYFYFFVLPLADDAK